MSIVAMAEMLCLGVAFGGFGGLFGVGGGIIAIPVIGVLSSAALLGEPIGASELLSLVLVIAALALVMRPGPARR